MADAICDRFYCSHGIAPQVICKEGLGYYGIALQPVICSVNGSNCRPIGRFTMAGDVENWIIGKPGDHGLVLEGHESETMESLLSAAIAHLRLLPYPIKSHASCRHARKGRSFMLTFRIAARLAQQHDQLLIWNAPSEVDTLARRFDPEFMPSLDPGYILFNTRQAQVLVSGDGKLLLPSGPSLWEAFMKGETEQSLVRRLEALLKLDQ